MPETRPPFTNVIGRLSKDAFAKTAGNGKEVVAFSVTRRTGFKSDGEQYDPSEFYDVEVWDSDTRDWEHARFLAARSLRKGQRVAIESMEPKAREHNGRTYLTLRPVGIWRLEDIEVEGDDSEDI